MCGIVTAFSKLGQSVNTIVVDQFQDQHHRGKEGYGAAMLLNGADNKTFVDIKRATTEAKILVDIYMNPSSAILFHHRLPTSSANLRSQTHPIFVSNDLFTHDYFIVHNGVIQNADALKVGHEKDGFQYTTALPGTTKNFNDSESLAIEIALMIEGHNDKIHTIGSAAFVGFKINKVTRELVDIIYGRNYQNPIKVFESDKILLLSSEGYGTDVEAHQLFTYNVASGITTKQELRLEANYAVPAHNYTGFNYNYNKEDDEENNKYFVGREDSETLKGSHADKESVSSSNNDEKNDDDKELSNLSYEDDPVTLLYENYLEDASVMVDEYISCLMTPQTLDMAEDCRQRLIDALIAIEAEMATYHTNNTIAEENKAIKNAHMGS